MIAALRGTVLAKGLNRLILDVRGVGYDVAVSLSTLERLAEGEEIFLHIHTALRENALELYGFTELDEKTLFEMLIGVSGIGPRLGITILSGIAPEQFIAAVMEGNVRRLTAIPGIGKKSAERIVFELQEKIKRDGLRTLTGGDGAGPVSVEEDLVSSLVNLGYPENRARQTSRMVLTSGNGELTLPAAVKLALKELMK